MFPSNKMKECVAGNSGHKLTVGAPPNDSVSKDFTVIYKWGVTVEAEQTVPPSDGTNDISGSTEKVNIPTKIEDIVTKRGVVAERAK